MLKERTERNKTLLSKRQLEILELAAQGLSRKQIARKLGISPYTVDKHLYSKEFPEGIFSRLKVHSRRGAVVETISRGFINPEKLFSKEQIERCRLLSPRQRQTLSLLANPSLPNVRLESIEVGDEMGISSRTVKNSLTKVYRKLGLEDFPPEQNRRSALAAAMFLAFKNKEEK